MSRFLDSLPKETSDYFYSRIALYTNGGAVIMSGVDYRELLSVNFTADSAMVSVSRILWLRELIDYTIWSLTDWDHYQHVVSALKSANINFDDITSRRSDLLDNLERWDSIKNHLLSNREIYSYEMRLLK